MSLWEALGAAYGGGATLVAAVLLWGAYVAPLRRRARLSYLRDLRRAMGR